MVYTSSVPVAIRQERADSFVSGLLRLIRSGVLYTKNGFLAAVVRLSFFCADYSCSICRRFLGKLPCGTFLYQSLHSYEVGRLVFYLKNEL